MNFRYIGSLGTNFHPIYLIADISDDISINFEHLNQKMWPIYPYPLHLKFDCDHMEWTLELKMELKV